MMRVVAIVVAAGIICWLVVNSVRHRSAVVRNGTDAEVTVELQLDDIAPSPMTIPATERRTVPLNGFLSRDAALLVRIDGGKATHCGYEGKLSPPRDYVIWVREGADGKLALCEPL